jgi:hypothetical protein
MRSIGPHALASEKQSLVHAGHVPVEGVRRGCDWWRLRLLATVNSTEEHVIQKLAEHRSSFKDVGLGRKNQK